MASIKLNTKHLSEQVRKILDEDGITPEEIAINGKFAKSTIYAILTEKNPTSQRAIARKIAEGTGRKFRIEGDKIFYYKEEPANDSDNGDETVPYYDFEQPEKMSDEQRETLVNYLNQHFFAGKLGIDTQKFLKELLRLNRKQQNAMLNIMDNLRHLEDDETE